MGRVTQRLKVERRDGRTLRRIESVAVEEPLEIRVAARPDGGVPAGSSPLRPPSTTVTTTMRLPRDDFDLALGHLVAEGLVADGLDPKDIDAGFAWVGYHAQTPLGSADPAPENVGFWGGQFADTRQCTVVSMGEPTVGVGLTERLPYSKYVVTGTDQVVIERLPECR